MTKVKRISMTPPASSQGQTTTEFAMLALPALILLFAIIQGASVVSTYNFVSYAARDAARYAMVRGSSSPSPVTAGEVTSYVQGEAQGLNTANLTVTTTWVPNNNPGSVVKVQVSYSDAPLAWFVSSLTLNLSSTSQMVISQ